MIYIDNKQQLFEGGTITIDGKAYEYSQLVMLPTNEKTSLYRTFVSNKLYHSISKIDKESSYTDVVYQHLYILSDEKIKKGDWFWGDGMIKPEQAKVFEHNLVNGFVKSACRKVIVTTDDSLTTNSSDKQYKYLHYPHQPSKSFIEKFVEYYNNRTEF